MDVRFTAWAGYELTESTTVSGIEEIHHYHAICDPSMSSDYVGNKHLVATPGSTPSINVQDLRPGRIRAFPVPE